LGEEILRKLFRNKRNNQFSITLPKDLKVLDKKGKKDTEPWIRLKVEGLVWKK